MGGDVRVVLNVEEQSKNLQQQQQQHPTHPTVADLVCLRIIDIFIVVNVSLVLSHVRLVVNRNLQPTAGRKYVYFF